MNVFILNTGRCGSTTFIQACGHIENYSAAHESNIHKISEGRLSYGKNHIEADNRLSWMLGRLDRTYGNDAYYVHLRRDRESTARSFAGRMDYGIMKAYREGVLLGGMAHQTDYMIAMDYVETVEANIALFLENKSNKMDFSLAHARRDFQKFWRNIHAKGDLASALLEWRVCYNASESDSP